MKSHRHDSLPVRRSVGSCLLLLAILFWFPASSFTQTSTPSNVPSGFRPGFIFYFAGNGTSDQGSYADGSVPTQVPINPVSAVATDSQGNTYIGANAAIYVVYGGGTVPQALKNITKTPTPGRIYQIAGLLQYVCSGGPDPTCGEGQTLNNAVFTTIAALAFDSAGNLYICDSSSFVVRKVDAATSIVTTVAGQLNVESFSPALGDGGPATSATLNYPNSIAIDSSGNIFINDLLNYVVRVVYSGTASPPVLAAEGLPPTPGFIYTIAGQAQQFCFNNPTAGSSGAPGACGDYGPATGAAAFLVGPNSVAVDTAGNVYIADAYPPIAYIRMVYAAPLAGSSAPPLLDLFLDGSAPTPGNIYAVTGYGTNTQFANCTAAPCGDGGLAANMEFGATSNYLSATLDNSNTLYITDPGDFAVRKIDNSGYASTIAGIDNPNQTPPANPPAAAGGPATSTQLSNNLPAIAFDSQDNLYIADAGDFLVWQAQPLLSQTINFPAFEPVTYGTGAIALAATASSGLPVTYAVTSGPGHLNGSELIVTGAGAVDVTASQGGNAQYAAATPVTRTLTVDPALLTVTANSASKLFGQPNPTFTANYSGFVSGDTAANSVSGQPAFSTTATTTSDTGIYPITISQGTLSSSKYTFTFVQGATLTITGSTAQTITFPTPPSVVYGQEPTVTLMATSTSGLPVSFTVVSGPAKNVAGGAVLTITGGGTVVIIANQNGNNTYKAAAPVTQSLTVKPAPLTVTGPTVSLVYGTTINSSTFPPATITGFVGTDNASLVSGSAQYTLNVTGTPNVGAYPIAVSQGTLALLPGATASYVLSTYVSGSLIITPGSQTITFNPVASSQTYGNPVSLTAVASSQLPITLTITAGSGYFAPNAGQTATTTNPSMGFNTATLQPTGVGNLTVTLTQAGTSDIQAAPPVTQVFNVGQAPLNIAAYPPQVREQGAQNPIFPYVIGNPSGGSGSFVNGDSDIPSVISGVPQLTTAATQDSPPGVYPVVITQGTLGATNYYFVFMNGQLTVTPPGDFTITANPPSLTIPAGQSRQATLTITPTNAYQGTVTLSCGQLPANVNCLISPSSFVFPGSQNPDGSENPAQGTLTIVAARGTVVGSIQKGTSLREAATLLIPGGLAGLMIAFVRRRVAKQTGIWGAIALFAAVVSMLTISSCGGSSQSMFATPGTSTVMIMGSGTSVTGNGTVVSSTSLSVTIQ